MRITNIKQQVKRSDRYSVFVDGAYSFSLSEGALLEYGLASGQEITTEALKDLKEAAGNDKAYGNALRYVALRPRSEWEVRTYLHRKEVDEPVIAQIIERLQRVQLLDDAAFARAWVTNRRLLKPISQRKLLQELQQKHVPRAVIDQVMADEPADEQTALQALIAKKRNRYPDDLKLMQYLARQGFGYDHIKRAMRADIDD